MTTFFTADQHFDHAGIISMCERPFSSVEEMNETMIQNWNAVVGPKDTVYVLGDFAYKMEEEALKKIFRRLRGHKHLVIGNHDKTRTRNLPWTTPPAHRIFTKMNGKPLVLDHYGLRVWPGMWHDAIHLYGHSHGKLPGNGRSLDVGVDCWAFFPVTLEQIEERIATQTFTQPEIGHDPED